MSEGIKKEHAFFVRQTATFTAACSAVNFDSGHAFIFDSPDVVLSRTLAYLLAMRTVCPSACCQCKKCERIMTGNALDVIDVSQDKFVAADVDAVIDGSLLSPYEMPYKFFILNFSERNDAVQNKLLKTLEEPPRTAKFIILTTSQASLLPTVRSRCAAISPSLGEKVQIEADDDFNPNLPYARYCARGSLTEFDNIMSGRNTDSFLSALNIVKGLGKSSDMVRLLKYLPTAGNNIRSKLKKTIGYLELILGDVMLTLGGLRVNTYGLYDMSAQKTKFGGGGISESLKAVRRAAGRLDNGNLTGVADELIIKLTEVNYNAQSGRD